MRRRPPTITVGALFTLSHWAERGWYAIERRDYTSGLTAITYTHRTTHAERVAVFDRGTGTLAGQYVTDYNGPATISAAIHRFRNGQRTRFVGGRWWPYRQPVEECA